MRASLNILHNSNAVETLAWDLRKALQQFYYPLSPFRSNPIHQTIAANKEYMTRIIHDDSCTELPHQTPAPCNEDTAHSIIHRRYGDAFRAHIYSQWLTHDQRNAFMMNTNYKQELYFGPALHVTLS